MFAWAVVASSLIKPLALPSWLEFVVRIVAVAEGLNQRVPVNVFVDPGVQPLLRTTSKLPARIVPLASVPVANVALVALLFRIVAAAVPAVEPVTVRPWPFKSIV